MLREPLLLWIISRLTCISASGLGTLLYSAKAKPVNLFYLDAPLLPLLRWDARWYLEIAFEGYRFDPQATYLQPVVFFPLYPLLIRIGSYLSFPGDLAAILIANGCYLAAACLLYVLLCKRFDQKTARWTLLVWLMFPTSFFGGVGYTEGVIALLSVLWLWQFWQEKYIKAGLCGAIASGLRPQGILLAIPLLASSTDNKKRRHAITGALLSGIGLLSFMCYLYVHFGDPLAFIKAQEPWRPGEAWTLNPLSWLYSTVRGLLTLHQGLFADCVALLWVIAWLPRTWKILQAPLTLGVIAMLVMPLSTGSTLSMARFCWMLLPVFIAVGATLAKSRWRWLHLTVSVTWMVLLAFLFGANYPIL